MRWQGSKSVFAENIHAAIPQLDNKRAMAFAKKTCWKCQKDKSTLGGHIKTFKDGPMKFVCKDCLEAKLKDDRELMQRALKTLEQIYEGCGYVIEDKHTIHKDAVNLATMIRKDCSKAIQQAKLKEKNT